MSDLSSSANGGGLTELLTMLAGANIFDMYNLVDESFPGLLPTVVGLGLILGGPRLSQNNSYYYAFMGIYASVALVMVLGFLKSPKHGVIQLSLMSTMGFIWKDDIFRYGFVLWVGLVAVSLTVAWWCGPPENSRTRVLINAATALTGVLLVWLQAMGPIQLIGNLGELVTTNDTDLTTTSLQRLVLVLIFAIAHNSGLLGFAIAWAIPWQLFGKLAWALFPPTPRPLLTEQEYHAEGIRETKRVTASLKDQLRGLAASELVNVLSKLKDPKGFIEYLANGEHVTEDARTAWEDGDHYITTTQDDDGFDLDDDFDDEDDDDEVVYQRAPPGRHAVPTPKSQVRRRHPDAVATPYTQAVRGHLGTPQSQSHRSATKPNAPTPRVSVAPRAQHSAGRGKGKGKARGAAARGVFSLGELEAMDSAELLAAMASVGMDARPITATSRPLLIKMVLKKSSL